MGPEMYMHRMTNLGYFSTDFTDSYGFSPKERLLVLFCVFVLPCQLPLQIQTVATAVNFEELKRILAHNFIEGTA